MVGFHGLHGSFMGSHGFWLVSMVFQGSFMVFHGFQGSFMVYHGFWLVSIAFQGGLTVYHGFRLVSKVLIVEFTREVNGKKS